MLYCPALLPLKLLNGCREELSVRLVAQPQQVIRLAGVLLYAVLVPRFCRFVAIFTAFCGSKMYL